MEKRKQKFSLRKNKIGAVSVLLGISFVGVGVSTGDAKAAEVNQETNPKIIVKTVEGKTKKSEVDAANKKVQESTKKAAEIKDEIKYKNAVLNKNGRIIQDITTEIEENKHINDEFIANEEKKSSQLTSELETVNKELLGAKTEQKNKELEQLEASKDIKNKEKDLQNKENKVSEIKSEIASVRVEQDITGNNKNIRGNAELDAEQVKKANAEKDLVKAQAFDKALEEKIKIVEENIQVKNAELKSKQIEVDKAKVEEDKKKDALNNITKPYGKNVKYKIALDNRFVSKFKEYMDYTINYKAKGLTLDQMRTKKNALKEELKTIEKAIGYEAVYNNYSHEDDYMIDLKNMSEAERLKMSQYGVYLLNQIRSQFGLTPLKVNKNSMQLAKEITETMMRDNHSQINALHYFKGLDEVAKKNGLVRGYNFYENLYNAESSTRADHKMSRNELYEHIYNSMLTFFYEGVATDSYIHAESFYRDKDPFGLGVAHFENIGDVENINRLNIEKYKEYLEFDEFKNVIGFKDMPEEIYNEIEAEKAKLPKRGIIKISYFKVPNSMAAPGEYNKTKSTLKYDAVDQDKANAESEKNHKIKYSNESAATVDIPGIPDYKVLDKEYKDAVKLRENKQKELASLQKEVENEKKSLETLNKTEKQTAKVQEKLKNIEKNISEIIKKINSQNTASDKLYIEKINNLKLSLTSAENDVKESEKVLADAKALEVAKKVELEKINSKIVNLEAKIAGIRKNIEDKTNYISNLRLAKEKLDENKINLQKELAYRSEIEADLNKLKTELNVITKQLEQDTKELEKIQKQFDSDSFKWGVLADNNVNEIVEFDLEKYLKDEEEKKNSKQNEPDSPKTSDEKHDLVPKGIDNKKEASKNDRVSNLKRSTGVNTLPNTGESQTGIATVAGLVGLAVAARLRQRKEK